MNKIYNYIDNMHSTFRRQRVSLLSAELAGCCLKQCLLKPEPAPKPIQKADSEKKDRKRRLSLYSVSSLQEEQSEEEGNKSYGMELLERKMSSEIRMRENGNSQKLVGKVGMDQRRRTSEWVIASDGKNKENENGVGESDGMRKGLKVMLAEKLGKHFSTGQCTGTPFRVNVRRPSSTIDYYNESQPAIRRAQTSLRNRFSIMEPSFPHSIFSSNSSTSKRASTPSNHPLIPTLSTQTLIPSQIPTPCAKLSFNSVPESVRMAQYRSKAAPRQNKFISVPPSIEDLSEIVDKRTVSEIISYSKANETRSQKNHTTSRFPSQHQQFNSTSRPQQKIKKLEEYFKRGGYRGSGRISSVYIVEEKQLGALFASKEVFKKTIYHRDITIEMEREIVMHHALPAHPNIVSLYQVLEDYQRYYFILEIGECNLRSLMNAPVSQSTARQYLKDILHGLEFLHTHSIIHRHLKPENIILAHGCCKLTDFGWAPKLLYMNNHAEIPEYSSPQVVRQEPYNQKTDIWSVGVIAYELLAGVKPFSGFTEDYQLGFETVAISKSMRRLIQRLLEPVEDRRATVGEALRLLEE